MITKIADLVKELNGFKIHQTTMSWEESLSDDMWYYYFDKKFKVVSSGLHVNTHRWYETSVTVLDMGNENYLGVRHVSNVFSESMGVRDCDVHLEFFELMPITTVTYIKKPDVI